MDVVQTQPRSEEANLQRATKTIVERLRSAPETTIESRTKAIQAALSEAGIGANVGLALGMPCVIAGGILALCIWGALAASGDGSLPLVVLASAGAVWFGAWTIGLGTGAVGGLLTSITFGAIATVRSLKQPESPAKPSPRDLLYQCQGKGDVWQDLEHYFRLLPAAARGDWDRDGKRTKAQDQFEAQFRPLMPWMRSVMQEVSDGGHQ